MGRPGIRGHRPALRSRDVRLVAVPGLVHRLGHVFRCGAAAEHVLRGDNPGVADVRVGEQLVGDRCRLVLGAKLERDKGSRRRAIELRGDSNA